MLMHLKDCGHCAILPSVWRAVKIVRAFLVSFSSAGLLVSVCGHRFHAVHHGLDIVLLDSQWSVMHVAKADVLWVLCHVLESWLGLLRSVHHLGIMN